MPLLVACVVVLGAGQVRAEASGTEPSAPATGIDPRPRRGTYAETTLGIFTTLGGSRALSNAQPYLGMTVGHDLDDVSSLFVSLGIGASSASCFDPTPTGGCNAADSFGATYLEVGGSYGVLLSPRVRLSGKLLAGVTQLAPGPVRDTVAQVVPDSLLGPHAGFGVSLDYDTHLDHFAVGVDVLARYSLAQRPGSGNFGLLSLAAMPRLRYVF